MLLLIFGPPFVSFAGVNTATTFLVKAKVDEISKVVIFSSISTLFTIITLHTPYEELQ
ncbi:uncharacterized protein BX663DRAFT_507330 [Cokeromyces recurvatus]|uniref:uncharacterized protein n=1 Tax=Cokeromyces recurvatus TaxID=90255 RepID=UPI00221ED9DF|nr:uncharacterized protein BX663DRAFT_507330 [Cokeromyces recurvatus]KAI7903700.1 hypothetical protein BX663DRAFT_507330 [Cokeromyces recurvatus]